MPSLDIDIDINTLNARPGAGRRARSNSDVTSTQIKIGDPVVATARPKEEPKDRKKPLGDKITTNYPAFHQNWDADLRSYIYLNDFLMTLNAGWLDKYAGVAEQDGRIRPQRMTQDQLRDQIMGTDRDPATGKPIIGILDLAKERESRFSEIIDQDDAEGALSYWFGMLKIDPPQHPATNLLVRVGRRIGEHMVMCLKDHFLSPRPSQLCPVISPMIDPPVTPSFPAGHSLQSYLISHLLNYSLPGLPQRQLLFDLAERVGQNRIVAGIHYPCDHEAGKAVAAVCAADVLAVPSIQTLVEQIQTTEFSQYAA